MASLARINEIDGTHSLIFYCGELPADESIGAVAAGVVVRLVTAGTSRGIPPSVVESLWAETGGLLG